MSSPETQIYLLLGGGTDSAALIPFYLRQQVSIQAIHFNYGQPSFAGEDRAVSKIADHYKIPLSKLNLGFQPKCTKGEYHSRNAILLLSAASIVADRKGRVAIGIHSGTPYYDCSAGFLSDIQRVFDGYFNGLIQVEAPFLNFSKQDIYQYCKLTNVPTHMTFSCEQLSDRACGQCPSCLDRRMLDEAR
jgi:7-cyano-7-deazaguanine synthase